MSSKIFKDVVIYKSGGGNVYISKNPLPLSVGFDPNRIIGEANVRIENGIVYADIEIVDIEENLPKFADHMFPYVGGRLSSCGFHLESTAIGANPNEDTGIMTLGDYITAPGKNL